jgi:hypothetical protein
MSESSTFENNAIFQAYRHKPRKIYSCVDADRGKSSTGVHPGAEFAFRNGPELSKS